MLDLKFIKVGFHLGWRTTRPFNEIVKPEKNDINDRDTWSIRYLLFKRNEDNKREI